MIRINRWERTTPGPSLSSPPSSSWSTLTVEEWACIAADTGARLLRPEVPRGQIYLYSTSPSASLWAEWYFTPLYHTFAWPLWTVASGVSSFWTYSIDSLRFERTCSWSILSLWDRWALSEGWGWPSSISEDPWAWLSWEWKDQGSFRWCISCRGHWRAWGASPLSERTEWPQWLEASSDGKWWLR